MNSARTDRGGPPAALRGRPRSGRAASRRRLQSRGRPRLARSPVGPATRQAFGIRTRAPTPRRPRRTHVRRGRRLSPIRRYGWPAESHRSARAATTRPSRRRVPRARAAGASRTPPCRFSPSSHPITGPRGGGALVTRASDRQEPAARCLESRRTSFSFFSSLVLPLPRALMSAVGTRASQLARPICSSSRTDRRGKPRTSRCRARALTLFET